MAGVDQLIFAGGFLWVLHRNQSCLMRLDLDRRAEIGPGVPLGPDPADVTVRNGVLYVIDASDRSLRRFDATSGEAIGKPVRVPGEGRLADVDERAGTISVLDQTNSALIMISPRVLAALERTSDVRTRRTRKCPASGA
jgi:DNA-binding beta-propeller fold protein YncE